MKEISFLYRLLFNREKNHYNIQHLELFHSDNYLRPNHPNYKLCPKCNLVATNNKEVVDQFGFKNVNGKLNTQSWCKHCRKINYINKPAKLMKQLKIDIS